MTWRRIFIDGVSCSLSMVKPSSARMKRRTFSITDKIAVHAVYGALQPLVEVGRVRNLQVRHQ